MPSRHRSILCSASLLALAACADRAAPPAAPPATALTPVLALDLPLGGDSVRIGSLRDATRLPDGRLVALDGDRHDMVFLDSSGMVLRRVGREGAGPGEFAMPAWIKRCAGDSLFVLDIRLARMSVFGAQGDYVREFRMPLANPVQLACSGTGRFAAFDPSGVPPTPPKPGGDQPFYHGDVLIFSTTGDTLGVLADKPLGENRRMGALGAIGFAGDTILLGVSSTPVFTRFGTDGSTLGSDSFVLAPRAVSDSLYDAELDRISRAMGGDSATQARVRAMLAVVPKPAVAPLYQAFRIAPGGTRWLITSLPTDPETRLLGRRPDGSLVAASFARNMDIYEIGDDYLLGGGPGPEGDAHLLLYRWTPP